MSLFQIGSTKPPGDAIEALLECHARIRHFVALSGRLAEASGEPIGEITEVAGNIHRYLTEALPLHADDENDSLAPRLQGRDIRLDAELERMVSDHQEHDLVLNPVISACERLLAVPSDAAALAPRFAVASVNLAAHFAGHLRREEELIFPAARRLLSSADLAEIWGEMRERRTGISAPPL